MKSAKGSRKERMRSVVAIVKGSKERESKPPREVWVEARGHGPRSALGALKSYLVGSWKNLPNSFPMAKEMEE